MAINKVGSKGIEDGSVATVDLAPGSVTNPKLANSSFTFDGTSVSLGASESVNVSASWQSVITADGSTGTTAVAGNGYFIDTTSATHTLTLPASATIGDFIAIKDYAGTFGTNNLTIARNGHNIQGVANDSLITTNRASLVLVYVDSTKGWLYWEEHNVADLEYYVAATGGTITTSGDYKIHTFTGDGCFVVSSASPSSIVDTVIVAGGGGGGRDLGGGGGAGGLRNISSVPVITTTYPITVGSGGAGSTNATLRGGGGSTSSFACNSSAGGGGGSSGNAVPVQTGAPGGSGGGGRYARDPNTGGTGNTPPVSPPQGNNGGPGGPSVFGPGCARSGGGGGASVAGTAGALISCNACAGKGGDGVDVSLDFPGTPNCGTYAGGGAGATNQCNPAIPGGTGGGGTSNTSQGGSGSPGTVNTGGGGAGGNGGGGSGGSGIVIIKYKFQ